MPSIMIGKFNATSFVATMAATYLLGRLTAQDGPRLENLQAAGGDYGVPMPRGHGEKGRLTGAFIVQDEIEEHEHSVEDYSEIVGAIGGAAVGFQYGGAIGLTGPIGAAVGAAVGLVAGFLAPDQKYYTYTDTFALLLLDRTNDDPIEGVLKVWANGKKIFDSTQSAVHSTTLGTDGKLVRKKYLKNKYMKSLAVYSGHTEQFVDPVLEEEEGEDNAYVFSAYIVIQDLQLGPFGNSVPACEVLVQIKTGETFAEAAEVICNAAGIDPVHDVSTTAINDDVIKGYLITSETTCWDALKPLLPVFGSDAAEVAGQVRFYKRSQSMRATIPEDDLGAHAFGDSPPQKFAFKRVSDLDLPQETSLTFIDPARDYQPNTASSSRSEGNAKSNVNVSINLVLTADEGASAAALMHWDSWLGRTQLSFSLTDQWLGLSAGLAYGFPIADQVVPYRVTRKLRGANGIIEVEALSDESVTYTASIAGSSGTVPDDGNTLFADTRLILMDMPLIQDAHDDYGYYIVMGGSESDWPRGAIQVSADGTNFVTIIDQPHSTVMGDVTGTLVAGTTTGLDDTLDTTTVLTVVLLHDGMTLSSATDAQLDAYANFCYVGKDGLGEYLQFKTATFVSGTTWQLTNLRRGRRGTDHAITTHASGEEFALLGGPGVFRIIYSDTSKWGEEFTYRGVTLNQDEADAATQTFTNTGEGKRPFSPVNVEGTWDGSNNLTITWDSRSRLFAGGLGIDDNAEWDVEFDGSPDHTETVVAETATFSAAEQTAAGLTPGDTVTGRVRQTSDVNDGRWREFTIVGPNALTFDSSLATFDDTSFTWDAG